MSHSWPHATTQTASHGRASILGIKGGPRMALKPRYFRKTASFRISVRIWENLGRAEAEVEWFYEDLQDLLELTPKKDVLFIIGDWNAKVGSQETPGVTGKFGLGIRSEAGQRLIEFCQENALVIANILFQQHKRRLYTWASPDGQHQNQIDYILCSQR